MDDAAGAGRNAPSDGVHVSEAAGTLAMTRRCMFWIPPAADLGRGGLAPRPVFNSIDMDENDDSKMKIPYVDVDRWCFGRIGGGAHYLLVHVGDLAFKFFPFYDGEVQEMTGALADLTGQPHFDEKAYVQRIVAEELAALRVTALVNLTNLNPNEEWIIRNNADLISVLQKMLTGSKPQSLYDLERLYHSCRLNHEVTKEAIVHIRHHWNDAKDEMTRKKILNVVDRLLDQSVMVVGNENFSTMSGWIRRVADHLDPYTNPESVAILEVLKTRIEDFKKSSITAIPRTRVVEFFDMIPELEVYQETLFSTMGVRLNLEDSD